LAGFEVTLYGRFWVTPEGQDRKETSTPIPRESDQENPPAARAPVGVSSSSEKNLCFSLAPLATRQTPLNRTDGEKPAQTPASLPADDDERTPRPRAPAETPRKEFLLRVAERHPEQDARVLLALVEKDLRKARISMEEILAYDTRHTTNHAAIKNPPGYYRWLAQSVVSERADAMKTGIPAGFHVAETSRCPHCKGGYQPTGEFCTCQLGRDLERYERRKAEKAAKANVRYPDSVETSDGSGSRVLPPPARQAARATEMLKRAAGGSP